MAYGAVSHFSVYPEYGVVVSVMMNKNQGAFGELPVRLTDLFVSDIKVRRATNAR